MNKVVQDYVDTDGTLEVFMLHKIGHTLGGMAITILSFYILNNFFFAFIVVASIAVIRELMKPIPLYMHIATITITTLGCILAIPLLHLGLIYQVIVAAVASVYVIATLALTQ